MARRKWQPTPPPTMHEVIRNMIRTTSHTYKGGDYSTTLDEIYFRTWGHTKEEVNAELSKWVSLEGVELTTPIVLPARFFE